MGIYYSNGYIWGSIANYHNVYYLVTAFVIHFAVFIKPLVR